VRRAEAVEVGARLAAERDEIREAFGRDERRACGAAATARITPSD
jgi:hypothetical protein